MSSSNPVAWGPPIRKAVVVEPKNTRHASSWEITGKTAGKPVGKAVGKAIGKAVGKTAGKTAGKAIGKAVAGIDVGKPSRLV
jgi:hypothetical protein